MKFCSPECKHRGAHPKGKDHWNWKGGITRRTFAENSLTRKIAAERGRCERCGATKHLHGHHIEHRSKNRERALDPGNIQVLCASCHALEHPNIAGLVSFPPKRRGATIQCIVCGKSRYEKASRAKGAKYCSLECYWSVKVGNGQPPAALETAECVVCNAIFSRRANSRGFMRCCSRSCAAKRGHIIRASL